MEDQAGNQTQQPEEPIKAQVKNKGKHSG